MTPLQNVLYCGVKIGQTFVMWVQGIKNIWRKMHVYWQCKILCCKHGYYQIDAHWNFLLPNLCACITNRSIMFGLYSVTGMIRSYWLCFHWFDCQQAVSLISHQVCTETFSSMVSPVVVIAIYMLTHWGWDEMDDISQTTFSNAFSWTKMYKFRLRFPRSLLSGVQWTISHH